MSIVVFSIEFPPDGNDSGRLVIHRRWSLPAPALCHQMGYTLRRSELRSVCFTSSSWPVRFQRSGDATAASLSDGELQAVFYTDAPSAITKTATGAFTWLRNGNNPMASEFVDRTVW